MIIWNGLGFVPIVFIMVFGFAFSTGSNGRITDKDMAYTLFCTAVACGVIGWWLRQRPGRVVVDKATGKEIELRGSHSLFFYPDHLLVPDFPGDGYLRNSAGFDEALSVRVPRGFDSGVTFS
jgi:hypothetical protein